MSPEQPGRVVNVNSATLIMGATGSGKTSLLKTLAEYVWETYHKVTCINSTDGGGIPTGVQALMQKGIVRFWRMRTRDLPDGSLSFETCVRATQGWRPASLNPVTGETQPGVKLVPPITERYQMSCPNGHVVKVVPFQALLTATLCPTCRVMTDKTNARVVKTSTPTKGYEDIGAMCFDGLTSMLSWMMQDMGQRAGRLELRGEEGSIGGKVNSGDMKFGQVTRSHVGFGQSRAEELVTGSLAIPHLVVPPVFTALTLDTDDSGGLSVKGPLLIGRAKTPEAGAWVGNCMEALVLKNDRDQTFFRLQLREFVDDAGVRHLVKTRAAPGTMPAYLDDPPLEGGREAETAFTQFNLGVFFTLLHEALVTTTKAVEAQYPDAPGLPVGMVEVGESVQAGAPANTGGVVAAPGAGSPQPAPTGSTRVAAPAAPRGGKAQPVVKPVATRAASPAPPPVQNTQTAPPANRFGPLQAIQTAQSPAQAGTPATAAPPAEPPVAAAPPQEEEQEAPAASQAPVQQAQTAQPTPPPPRGAWAPPGAPRPPAMAPRVGGPAAPKQ